MFRRISSVKRAFGTMSVFAALATTLVGFGTTEATTGDTSESRPSIAFLVPMYRDHPYGLNYGENVMEAADEQDVDLLVMNSGYDAAVQSSQMKIAIARDVDGIVLWPGLYGGEEPMLVQAQRADIPVVVSNSRPSDDLDKDLYAAFTGPNDQRVGELQADELARILDGEGAYVYIGGEPGNAAAVNRQTGFERGMAEHPDIEELGSQPGNFDQNMSQTAASSLISRFGDNIDAIVTPDDIAAAGAAQALSAANMSGDVALIGHNFAPIGKTMIEDGDMTSTLFQSPCWDSKQALDVILDVVDGEDVQHQQYMPLPLVNEDNIDEFEPYGCLPEGYDEEPVD